MTNKSADPGEQLRELLRRMEQIPADEPPLERPGEAASLPEALRARRGFALRRHHAIWFALVAVGTAGAIAAAWAVVFRPNGGEVSAKVERDRAPIEARAPARPADAPYRVAAASETIVPPADAAPIIEARAPSTPAPVPAARPTLTVPAISAMAGQRVRVAVRVEPSSYAVRGGEIHVHGLPEGAKFSKGSVIAPDRWVVAMADAEALDLVIGQKLDGRFDLAIELYAANGRQLAETTSLLVVTAPPAPRPAPAVAAAPAEPPVRTADAKGRVAVAAPAAATPIATMSDTDRLDDATQDKFLIQGMRLLVIGNINSARLLFERAADAGNARAALLMGDTFDDVRLGQLGVMGVVPDRGKSVYWYERADELGAPEAKERLSELNLR